VCGRRLGGKSRMTRECPVRICEGGEVRFLSATRLFKAGMIKEHPSN